MQNTVHSSASEVELYARVFLAIAIWLLCEISGCGHLAELSGTNELPLLEEIADTLEGGSNRA